MPCAAASWGCSPALARGMPTSTTSPPPSAPRGCPVPLPYHGPIDRALLEQALAAFTLDAAALHWLQGTVVPPRSGSGR